MVELGDGGERVRGTSRCRACGRRVAMEQGCPDHGGAAQQSPEQPAEELPVFLRYQTLRRIAVGGFGAVFAAVPEDGGPELAVKLAHAERPDAGPRLVREAMILAEIGPPHAPAVIGRGALPDGSPYLVMERLACPTLADRLLAAGGAVPVEEACALVDASLRALVIVHARGYVHRDLKPENIFVAGGHAGPWATIIDFGLAVPAPGSRARGGDPDSVHTSEGAALGTPEYMAPEQCEGRHDLDERADLYAMGVILYELLAGRPPFWGPSAAVREDHRSRRPPRLRPAVKCSAALEDLVLRCLAKDRGDRFPSAVALRQALTRAAFTTGSIPPPRPSVSEVPTSSPPTSAPRHERRTVGLLFLETGLDLVSVQRRLSALGGEIARTSSGRVLAVFDHEAGASPARRALRAARDLVQRGACSRALLDLQPVVVQRRPDGARRYLIPASASPDAALPPEGHALYMTPAAAAALPDLPWAGAWSSGAGAGEGASALIPAQLDDEASSDPTSEPLIGRGDLLGALLEGARAVAAAGPPTVVSVIGETGLGKSHLASVIVRRLREVAPGAQVIDLRAREPLVGGADPTVRELLQHALDLPPGPPADGGRALLASRLGAERAELVPAVALALGWADGDTSPEGARAGAAWPDLRALTAAPGALRAAVSVAAGGALRRRAVRGPVLVVLDDAHLADDAALSALEYAALAEARAPLWICALARPSFEQARPDFGVRAGRRELYRLGPLDRESAAALCRRLLAPVEDVPEPAVDRLIARAQAVPLLLVELVLGLKREGIVRRHPRGGGWYVATDELDRLPDAPLIEWLARAELDALPPALQEHARLIALLGPEVSPAEIAGVLARLDRAGEGEAFPLDPGIALRRLLAAGVLAQDRRTARIRFRHLLVREAVAQSTASPQRARIHLAAFEHHRAQEGGGEARLRALAHHAAEAGLHEIAFGAYLALADQARARHAYVDAEALYSRALELAALAGEAAPSARRSRGLMRCRLGRYHDALEDLASARAAAEAAGDLAEQIGVMLDEATALDWTAEYRSSRAHVNAARELAARVAQLPPALEARLLLAVGRSLHRFSREEEAAATLERAATAAAGLGEDGYETLVVALLMLGFIYPGLGRLAEAGAALDRAVSLCEAHRDVLHLASAIGNRATLRACQGDKAGMIADLRRVQAIARELGQGMLELVAEFNLGELLILMDDLEAAAPHVGRAIEIERRRSGDAGRPLALLLDARLRLGAGDERGARAAWERILAHQEAARAAGRMDARLMPSEEVLLDMVDLATRDAGAAAWEALAARSAQLSVGQERVEVLEARAAAALRRGRAEEARAALARATGAAALIPNAMGARLARLAAEIEARTAPPRSTP